MTVRRETFQHFGGFLDGKATEETKFDHFAFPGMNPRKKLHGFV